MATIQEKLEAADRAGTARTIRATRQQKLDRAIDDLITATNKKDKRAMARVIADNYRDLRGVCAPDFPMIGKLLDLYDAGGLGMVTS